jgi:hypothetical protein
MQHTVKEFVSDPRDAIGRMEKRKQITILRLGIPVYVLECIGLERVKMPIVCSGIVMQQCWWFP